MDVEGAGSGFNLSSQHALLRFRCSLPSKRAVADVEGVLSLFSFFVLGKVSRTGRGLFIRPQLRRHPNIMKVKLNVHFYLFHKANVFLLS